MESPAVSGIGLLHEIKSVIDQRLMHGPQHGLFFMRRQSLDVPPKFNCPVSMADL
ncbi:MAG: hypothetical protein M2R45_03828 [Verrucomicrobia subdivision 3 bacterium]|nr:hypothetical protein [Limisphaerales bacterium]MCS1415784.1 hypothetical protein [Limisphaerales bacterium]